MGDRTTRPHGTRVPTIVVCTARALLVVAHLRGTPSSVESSLPSRNGLGCCRHVLATPTPRQVRLVLAHHARELSRHRTEP